MNKHKQFVKSMRSILGNMEKENEIRKEEKMEVTVSVGEVEAQMESLFGKGNKC